MTSSDAENSKLHNLERLWTPVDASVSEGLYRELLPLAEKLEGRERCLLIELHVYIARSQTVQEKAAEARASLTTAERLLEEHRDSYRVSTRIKWLIETGRLQVLEKIPSQARGRFAEAWTLSINSGEDALAAELALLLATVEPQKQQQEWIQRGIKLAEESPQPDAKRWLGPLHTSHGWKLYDLRQYEASLNAFQKALSHFKLAGSEREIFVAKWSAGKVLRALGRFEEALTIQNALLAELGVGGAKDGRVFEELGECLHALKRVPEAQVYFELAYRELSGDDWVVDNQPETLKRLKELGKAR